MNEKAPKRFILNKQQKATKNQIHNALKQKDTPLAMKLINLFNIAPHEEVSVEGYLWTTLHYASHFKVEKVFDYLLQKTYQEYKEDYVHIVNNKTSEGWNVLMTAAMYGSNECLELLIKYGGVKLYEKDKNGQRAIDLAKRYKQDIAFKMLTKAESDNPTKGTDNIENFVTPFNEGEFSAKPETREPAKTRTVNIEDWDEYQSLLLNGKRLPCMKCKKNTGWIKYAACCGNPIHPLCIKGDKNCFLCKKENFKLVTDLKFPEKAFQIEAKDD